MIRTAAPFARSLPQEKMAPEKNTTKRKVPITEEVIKKETRAEKKKDKKASCPDVTVLQEVKKHAVPSKFYYFF